MATTLGNLKSAIAAYGTRKVTDFVQDVGLGSTDSLLRAINNSKNYAQRAIEFFLAGSYLQVDNVSQTTGGSLTSAYVVGDGTKTAVGIRSIKHVYLQFPNSQGVFPIRMTSRNAYAERQKRRYAGVQSQLQAQQLTNYGNLQSQDFSFIQQGQTFYIASPCDDAFGGSGTFSVNLDVIKWLPDFSADADTSFLFDYCFDWLMFRSMWELNYFLKEDERFPVTSKMLDEYWNNIIQWNATVIGSNVDDVDLS
jgi:hypothetical protein